MSTTYEQTPDVAVALLYDGENAPRITAKGEGEVARQILELAREHGIPLEGDAELAEVLSQIPLGEEIPEALYRAIAEVIAFAYLVSGRRPVSESPTAAAELSHAGYHAGCGHPALSVPGCHGYAARHAGSAP